MQSAREYIRWYETLVKAYERSYEMIRSNEPRNVVGELGVARGICKQEVLDYYAKMRLSYTEYDKEYELFPKELRYFSASGVYLLEDRFTIPIKDYAGGLISVVGWNKQGTKYMTVPSPILSKECLLYGLKEAVEIGGWDYVVLVEGYFDCLALQAIGVPAVSTMGATVSRVKEVVLRKFRKVIVFSDNDVVGKREVLKWAVPAGSVRVKIDQELGVSDYIKDGDDLVKHYDSQDIRELFEEISKSTKLEEYIEL